MDKEIFANIALAQNPETWRRDQTPETIALRCALDTHPCEHRRNSDDNTCQHFPGATYKPGFMLKRQAD